MKITPELGLRNSVAVGWMLTKTGKTQGEKTVGGTWSTNKSKFCFGCGKFEMPIGHPTGSIKLVIW